MSDPEYILMSNSIRGAEKSTSKYLINVQLQFLKKISDKDYHFFHFFEKAILCNLATFGPFRLLQVKNRGCTFIRYLRVIPFLLSP